MDARRVDGRSVHGSCLMQHRRGFADVGVGSRNSQKCLRRRNVMRCSQGKCVMENMRARSHSHRRRSHWENNVQNCCQIFYRRNDQLSGSLSLSCKAAGSATHQFSQIEDEEDVPDWNTEGNSKANERQESWLDFDVDDADNERSVSKDFKSAAQFEIGDVVIGKIISSSQLGSEVELYSKSTKNVAAFGFMNSFESLYSPGRRKLERLRKASYRDYVALQKEGCLVMDEGFTCEFLIVGKTINGKPLLSAREPRLRLQYTRVKQLIDMEVVVDIEATRANRGGALGEIEGVDAFIPRCDILGYDTYDNHIVLKPGQTEETFNPILCMSDWIGKTYRVAFTKLLMETDSSASHCPSVRCSMKKASHLSYLRSIEIGTLVRGRVSSIRHNSVYLSHVDNNSPAYKLYPRGFSWRFVEDMAEIVKVGDVIYAMVSEVEKNRFGYNSIIVVTKVLEQEKGELKDRNNFLSIMEPEEAASRIKLYREERIDSGDVYYSRSFADVP